MEQNRRLENGPKEKNQNRYPTVGKEEESLGLRLFISAEYFQFVSYQAGSVSGGPVMGTSGFHWVLLGVVVQKHHRTRSRSWNPVKNP